MPSIDLPSAPRLTGAAFASAEDSLLLLVNFSL
jgi:hypothetical protein